MFELPSSRRAAPWTGHAASVLAHAALITLAVLATLEPRLVSAPRNPTVPVTFLDREVPPPPPPGHIPDLRLPALGPLRLSLPGVVPQVIPPPAARPIDVTRLGLAPAASPSGEAAAPPAPASAVYAERRVEERPELLSHPPVQYPELLRQAGIEGRVVLEAVVDTTGRIEAGSIVVITATSPLFALAARNALAGSVYRPGRVGGRPVRVRVRIPVEFRLSGHGGGT